MKINWLFLLTFLLFSSMQLKEQCNTDLIISTHVTIGIVGTTYSAQVCNDLQTEVNGKTYGDRYLSSKGELDMVCQANTIIDATAVTNGESAFTEACQLGSRKFSSTNVWEQKFSDNRK